jgi:hypothetical protein
LDLPYIGGSGLKRTVLSMTPRMPAARSAAVGIVFASLGVQPEGTIIAGFEKGGLVDVKVEVNESSESARLLAERLVGIVRWNCVPDPTPAGTTELIGLTYIVVREGAAALHVKLS